MSLLKDARGNEFLGTLDQIGGGLVTDARTSGALLGALNAELLMDLNGQSVAMFDVRTAAGSLTLVFEGTVDGTNYFTLPAFANQQTLAAALLGEEYVPSIIIATTATGFYTVGVSGVRRVRCRVSAFTSGNVNVTARASVADQIIYGRPIPSTKVAVIAGGANAAATLTLAAPGVGLFHYITFLDIRRHATAALVGTGAVAITSTNLPSAWGTRVGNAMVVGGTQIDLVQSFPNALKSSVANTATTIVGAAPGAAVLWNLTAHYYVGA